MSLDKRARVADFVMRVLASANATFARNAIDRPSGKGAFELRARLPFAAPAEGKGDAAARPQLVHETHAHAVGQPVAIVAVQDRQEHPAAAQLLDRSRREIVKRDARRFVDHHHQQDVVGILDRAEPLADLNAFEVATLLKPRRDLGDQGVGGRLADDLTHGRQDLGVGRGVVAMYAHFANDARRALRKRHRGPEEEHGGQPPAPSLKPHLILYVTSACL